jgi:ABC-type antimicrobial peptide transport system permease subunit
MGRRARELVSSIDVNLPLYWVMPMRQVLADNSWAFSLFGSLFTIFGGAALFLAAVGLYGVMSFSVAQRRREMGVRMALGAEARDILRIVFNRVFVQLAIGLAVGLGLGYALSQPLRFVMFGVETSDWSVYLAIVVTLVATGLIATFFPAQRAVRVDPLTALRPD